MFEPWWITQLRMIRWIFLYVGCPAFALGLPVLIGYGLTPPRADDFRSLSVVRGEAALLADFSRDVARSHTSSVTALDNALEQSVTASSLAQPAQRGR
jgi:hypothetical protein